MRDEPVSRTEHWKHPTESNNGLSLIVTVVIALMIGMVIGLIWGYFVRPSCENNCPSIAIDGTLSKLNTK